MTLKWTKNWRRKAILLCSRWRLPVASSWFGPLALVGREGHPWDPWWVCRYLSIPTESWDIELEASGIGYERIVPWSIGVILLPALWPTSPQKWHTRGIFLLSPLISSGIGGNSNRGLRAGRWQGKGWNIFHFVKCDFWVLTGRICIQDHQDRTLQCSSCKAHLEERGKNVMNPSEVP